MHCYSEAVVTTDSNHRQRHTSATFTLIAYIFDFVEGKKFALESCSGLEVIPYGLEI